MLGESAHFERWNESVQKFDYFMTGLSGAIIAFIGQSFLAERLGWNAGTIELIALLALVASFWCGIKRIEIYTDYLRLILQRETAEESTIHLRHHNNDLEPRSLQKGEPLTSEEKKIMAEDNMHLANSVQKVLESKCMKGMYYFRFRNYFLVLGFILLICSRFVSAYR